MARAGAEVKPTWQRLPRSLRAAAESLLGARVRRAERVWGGYAPSATFRLYLEDDRRVFFKGASRRDPNPQLHRSLTRELRVYRDLQPELAGWAPDFYGAVTHEDWLALLLQDVGPATVPPWTDSRARIAARAYGAFHAATFARPLPRWLPRQREWGNFGVRWQRLLDEKGGLAAVAALAAGREAEAIAWLEARAGPLNEAAHMLSRLGPPYALLHFDTRSDNIRLRKGRLWLFDWPYACAGPPEFDVVAFAQSVTCEGGPPPERFLAWYAERQPVRDRALAASLASIAGYFAGQARLPEVPSLPRLRSIQRRQLKASLAWASRHLHLPEPHWLATVPD
jgi:Phosphotransferase enzyme family